MKSSISYGEYFGIVYDPWGYLIQMGKSWQQNLNIKDCIFEGESIKTIIERIFNTSNREKKAPNIRKWKKGWLKISKKLNDLNSDHWYYLLYPFRNGKQANIGDI